MPDPILTTAIRPVWIASYPRSGNTYLRIILQNIFRLPTYSVYYVEGQNFPDPSAEALEEAPVLPRNWRQLISTDPNATITLIKTHDLPLDDAPAIYVVRDGRAAIDSYFHYQRKFAFDKPSLTEVIAGACQFGSWSGHFLGWRPESRPKTLFLRYEDLVNRPTEIIPRLAEFLKIKPAGGRLPTFEELKRQYPAFFRRGQNEDFRTTWTPGQRALFNALHGAVMGELKYPEDDALSLEPAAVVELARSASRLHELYLETLGKLGITANVSQQLSEETRRLKDIEAQQGQVIKSLLDSNWVKIGVSLRLLKYQRQNGAKAAAGTAPARCPADLETRPVPVPENSTPSSVTRS